MLSNLPLNVRSIDPAGQSINNISNIPIEVDPSIYAAMIGFFESRGFDNSSSESIATILYAQARKDGYKPLQILDTLKGFNKVELSALVSEILNYNRYKSSNLGKAQTIEPNPIVQYNIYI